ncbi:MAG TPA: hypothetical protein PLH56_00355 [Candidatus Omnitrophota bacterium]|nr:hypothetical protein [Candidatus Omnitrophota bacterium]
MIKKLNIKHLILFFIFIVFLIPTIYTISLYPNGGWDAWAVWNFKARTLFLGQNDWTNIFHPTLWRSSPHYPLFLPLLNVWGWIFSTTPTQNIPILVSILFTTLTLGLLFYSLRNRTPLFFNILLLLALSSSSLFYKFASSQYADIVIGFYLLASFYCLIQAKMKDNKTFALLSGIFLSILSFTKNEGLMASVIIGSLAIPYLLKQRSLNKKKILLSFFVGVFISCIPFIIFQFFYAPQNLTFINGFESLTKPSDFSRLKAIFMFYFFQLKTFSWNGFWIILLVGLILGKKKMFNAQTIIIPLFLILYGGILTLYYFLNTYFDILWWLSQTFHRIVFSLLPIIFYWLGTSLFWNKSQKEK